MNVSDGLRNDVRNGVWMLLTTYLNEIVLFNVYLMA